MAKPTEIKLHQNSRKLALSFDDGFTCELSCEFLRVHSPSAEVQGHGPGQEVLQYGKRNVNITQILPVGNYAVKLCFDDGHDSGLFTWEYLHSIGQQQELMWQRYLQKLSDAGLHR